MTSRFFVLERRRVVFGLCVVVASLAGCASYNRQAFDLSGAPARAGGTRAMRQGAALVVRTPEAIAPTGGDRVVIRAADGAVAVLPDAQWSDLLPNLLRRRLVDALQNAGIAAGDTGACPTALLTDIRRFEIDAGRNVAVVDISVRLIDVATGASKGGEAFVIETSAPDHYGAPAIAALSDAAGQASARIANWARHRL